MTKMLMNKLIEVLFLKRTYSWYTHIPVSVRVDSEYFDLKIVEIILGLVGWSQRTTLRVKKVKMFKSFRRKRLKSNIKLEGTWWYGVCCKGNLDNNILPHWIYNGKFRKATLNNPNYFGMSNVSISHFCSGLGWDKHRNVWHSICGWNICSSIFMKKHSRDCIKF